MTDVGPRYPFRAGDRVVDIVGKRSGEIVELLPVQGLPGARVRWIGYAAEETLPLGYLCRARSEDL